MNKVSLIQSTNSYDGALKALKPLKDSLREKISGLDKIVIKINFVTAHTELATTPIDSVRAFINFIQPFYKGKVIIAEEATIGTASGGFEKFGWVDLANNDSQVELFDSSQSKTKRVTINHPKGETEFGLARIFTDSPFVVSACRAKTHDTVVVTLSIKNLIVGAIQQKSFARRSNIHQGKDIHWIMTKIAKHTFPDFSLIDGVKGMQGNGPTSGSPINSNFLAVSLGPLAVDSVVANIMGFKTEDIGYLNLMKKENLGKLYPQDEIEIIGEKIEDLKTNYQPHSTVESQKRWRRD